MIYVILGILVYFAIGGFVAGLLDGRSEFDELYFMVFWPFFASLLIIYGLTLPTRKLGNFVADRMPKRKRNWNRKR